MKESLQIMQLNAWEFAMYPDLLDYVLEQQRKGLIDVLCMQEVHEGAVSRHKNKEQVGDKPLEHLAAQLGWNFAYGKRFSSTKDGKETGAVGSAILSKHPIHYRHAGYVPELGGGKYRKVDERDLGLHLRHDNPEEKLQMYQIHGNLPQVVVTAVLDVQGTHIRVITTHFPPGERGTNTQDMVKHAQYILDTFNHSMWLPTVLVGDFNVERGGNSLKMLEQRLRFVDTGHKTTLNPRTHPGFQAPAPGGIPKEGFMVDHILVSDELGVEDREVLDKPDSDVSDHHALRANLKLK